MKEKLTDKSFFIWVKILFCSHLRWSREIRVLVYLINWNLHSTLKTEKKKIKKKKIS